MRIMILQAMKRLAGGVDRAKPGQYRDTELEVASDSDGLCRRPVFGRLGEPRGCRMEHATYTSYGIKAWEG